MPIKSPVTKGWILLLNLAVTSYVLKTTPFPLKFKLQESMIRQVSLESQSIHSVWRVWIHYFLEQHKNLLLISNNIKLITGWRLVFLNFCDKMCRLFQGQKILKVFFFPFCRRGDGAFKSKVKTSDKKQKYSFRETDKRLKRLARRMTGECQ